MLTKTKLVLAAALVAGFASAGLAQDITDATHYERTNVTPFGNAYFGNAYGRATMPDAYNWQAPTTNRGFEQSWFDRASEGPVG